jgi:16S rRNA (uracil1498-N3)-methyltransferase
MSGHINFLFYTERVEADRLYLETAETRHAAAVLRREAGDPFLATDGSGTVFECRVESIDSKHSAGLIIDRKTMPRHACRLHVLVGVPERPAFEALMTDLTALGVERITPMVCRHCQGKWWERGAESERLSERLRKKMIASMKQSLYPYLPRLDPPLPFERIGAVMSGTCIVADREGVPFSEVLKAQSRTEVFSCLIGPPGGFAPEEQAELKVLGAVGVQIAPHRLTTQLAAVVLCGQIIGMQHSGTAPATFPGPAA